MILSRAWYLILAVIVGAAVYVVSLAVGQYNRRNQVAMAELLKSDSQAVGWALQVDSRRRLDNLLLLTVEKGVIESLKGANGKPEIPAKSKEDTRAAMAQFNDKLSAEFKSDAIFAVDREGRIVAQIGYDTPNSPAFELGGYAAVHDALHGWLRDDTWVWGNKIGRVVARPVVDEPGAPLGAVVAVRWVDATFAKELGKLTRTNVAFFTGGQKVSAGSWSDDKDELDTLDRVVPEIPKALEDAGFKKNGRTDVRAFAADDRTSGVFVKMPGDSWELGAGFAVTRNRAMIDGPQGFIKGADDKDKASVKIWLVAVVVVAAFLFGLLFSLFEHTMPLREMNAQSDRLKRGQIDAFQLPRLRSAYRAIAQNVNQGIERVVEKAGGQARKPADLESILGPVPAQPAMAAFSFPMPEGSSPNNTVPQSGPLPAPAASAPRAAPLSSPATMPFQPPGSGPRPTPGPQPGPAPGMVDPAFERTLAVGPQGPGAGAAPPAVVRPPTPPAGIAPPPPKPGPGAAPAPGREDEATTVGQAPADILAVASGERKAAAGGGPDASEAGEWMAVYEEFIRTKRQCGESVDGLTFEKFQGTLRKNRDALVQRHGCKRVKFSVYIKEGRASLKATPVRD